VKRWRERLKPVLTRFFDLSERTWRQGRLEKEWIFVQKQIEQKRCAGTASHKAKTLKTLETPPTAVPEPLPTAMPTERQQPTPTPKEDSVGASAPTAAAAAMPPALRVVHPEPIKQPQVRDFVKEAFGRSVTILGPKGRELVGQAKKRGHNALDILDALAATEHHCLGEPVAYFLECLRRCVQTNNNQSPGTNLFLGAHLAAEALIEREYNSGNLSTDCSSC
jgi:hypothetical protein